ncbi:hypothetical protein H1Q58_12445 [Planococcus maritimus]|uniref:Uncharacterized protein n=1 Tax=Planococcus maritimus TaxID=192421 RepID=A0A7D7MBD6_PLAMR|nr:hypothetical protein [Planococcus maritimus]QMT16769.1 hypothetical protein H1Q58_12445 [Planococcus maritimus]
MTEYELIKERLEKDHQRAIDDIMYQHYIEQDLGPAVGAKKLGIPRRAFVYFVQQCGLQKDKFDLIKKKVLNTGDWMAAL